MVWLVLVLCVPSRAEKWKLLGPDGGDARSLAYDPRNPDRIFMGTSTGSVFVSTNGGHSWSRFAHLGRGDDYVIDHIVLDPRNPEVMFASAWNLEEHNSGDVFRSHDAGQKWESLSDMHGKGIRVLAMAASDSNVLVAGALDGVYRTKDGGDTWLRISPANHAEIKNIESIAIDPKDPNVIYAGTWHLAWKTSDGGITWRHINQGMIDDSDVFSIIIDPTNAAVVYASACSGIYRSDSAGEVFQKVQGIPFAARRTRILKQDPNNPNVVYAGTTQGLWKTTDAGKSWRQVTNSSIVVNDLFVDPRNSSRLLLATDRGGVMASDNGGLTLVSSNYGYTHRYVTSILVDVKDPSALFVGIANDREWGGVFSFRDGGSWEQRSAGLGGRDVFALAQAANGTLFAGTNRGIFILRPHAGMWQPMGNRTLEKSAAAPPRTRNNNFADPPSATHSLMNAKINDLNVTSDRWLAATSEGLFSSVDNGKTWNGGPVLGRTDFVAVRRAANLLVVASRAEVLISLDDGTNWQVARFISELKGIRGLAIAPGGDIIVASREGAFRSPDSGATWQLMLNGLPDRDLSSVSYDDSAKVLLATSASSGVIFSSNDGGKLWSQGPDVGYPLRRVITVHGRFVAVTPFDGVIAQE